MLNSNFLRIFTQQTIYRNVGNNLKMEKRETLSSIIDRTDYLKKIGIDINNISNEINQLYKQKLRLSTDDLEHGKFISNLTFRDVLLLQVAEKEMLVEKDNNIAFFNGLYTERLDRKICSALKFLIAI